METLPEHVRIVFFGIGCSIIKGAFDEQEWNLLNQSSWSLKSNLDTAVFHPSFFETLKSGRFKSRRDLGTMFQISGLLLDDQSEIEIRIGNRKKKKIPFRELMNVNLLFPLYQTDMQKINVASTTEMKKLEIIEKEIGTVASFKFPCSNFSMDKLVFTIADVSISSGENFTLLSQLSYDGKTLPGNRPDTVVRGQFAVLS